MASLSAIEIKPGTTAIFTTIVEDEDITNATVYVTIDMGDIKLTKSNHHSNEGITLEAVYDEEVYDDPECVGTLVSVQYSQAETLRLRPGPASVEVGWVFENGTAGKSDIGRLHIARTLFKGVMDYGRADDLVDPTEDEDTISPAT